MPIDGWIVNKTSYQKDDRMFVTEVLKGMSRRIVYFPYKVKVGDIVLLKNNEREGRVK